MPTIFFLVHVTRGNNMKKKEYIILGIIVLITIIIIGNFIYNKNTNNYLDNTLTCNKYISVSSSNDDNSRLYYDCKSSFLRDITKHGVVVNAGGNK